MHVLRSTPVAGSKVTVTCYSPQTALRRSQWPACWGLSFVDTPPAPAHFVGGAPLLAHSPEVPQETEAECPQIRQEKFILATQDQLSYLGHPAGMLRKGPGRGQI